MSVVTKDMTLLAGKLIVYDGACPLCISLRDKVLRWDIFPADKVANYYELPAAQTAQIDPDRFRNEMALIDTDGGATIYGPDALKRIFSERYWLARMFFAIPGIMAPIRFIYKTLAFNRYVVSTPRKDMPACDCEPAGPPLYHLVYLLYSLLVAVGVTMLFGAGLSQYTRLSATEGAVAMLLIAGTGWVVQGLVSWLGYGERRFQYLRHLCTVMRKGVMPLLPVAILFMSFTDLTPWLPLVAVLYSSGLMLRQHYLRIWQLGGSQWWTVCWLLALQSTAVAWCLNLDLLF